jgi:hypothetical protein
LKKKYPYNTNVSGITCDVSKKEQRLQMLEKIKG